MNGPSFQYHKKAIIPVRLFYALLFISAVPGSTGAAFSDSAPLPATTGPALAPLPAAEFEPPLLPANSASSPFGINGLGYFFYRSSPDAAKIADRRATLMNAAGIDWDRSDFWWAVIEPKKGQFTYDTPDQAVEVYRKHNIQVMPILSYSSAWGHHPPATEEERKAFAGYAASMVKRYGAFIHAWEIWNEPNIPTFWKPQPSDVDYASLLKVAGPAIHAADPTALVVGGATSETDTDFLRKLAQHGAWGSIDVVSIHPYSMSDGPVESKLDLQIQRVQDLMRQVGQPKPIWITEMGWTAKPAGDSGSSPEALQQQSQYLVQSYVMALENGVQRLFWFNLEDFQEKWGLTSSDGKPKPSFNAYRVMSSYLSNATPKGMAPQVNGRAYAFEKAHGSIVVAWADRGQTATFTAPADAVAYDLDGGPVQRVKNAFSLSQTPVYIVSPALDLLTGAAPPNPLSYYRANLVVNGDFSLSTNGTPYGWHRGTFDGYHKAGTYGSATVGAKTFPELSDTQDALWESHYIAVEPGKRYHATAIMRPYAATGANTISLAFLGGAGWGWQGDTASPTITGTGDWQKVEVTVTAPPHAAFMRVHLNSAHNTGMVRFDSVVVQEE